ncbi:MAG: SLBB domain-containing protein [Armatimonadota bacterium]
MACATADEYVIGAGDTVKITVLDEADLTREALVDPEGNITMPLIGSVHVAGLTASKAASEIAQRYREYMKNPQVTVELAARVKQQVTVSGAVKQPGIYQVEKGARLMDVITLAGGYLETADLSKVSITKPNAESATIDLNRFLLTGDTGANVPVDAGYTVYVPARQTAVIGTVMVLGAVRQSGEHSIVDGMTVREALMLAGGPTETADLGRVELRRPGSTGTTTVDYAAACSGTGENPELKPGDVIYVSAKEYLGSYTIQGAVANPGKYELKEPTSITEAIAIAGGVRGHARLGEVRILRDSVAVRTNVKAIMSGETANVQLRAGDNINVPEEKGKPDYLRLISVAASLAWIFLGR